MYQLPKFETEQKLIKKNYVKLKSNLRKSINKLLRIPKSKSTFANTFESFSDILSTLETFHCRVEFLANVSCDAKIRETSRATSMKLGKCRLKIVTSKKIYKKLKSIKKPDFLNDALGTEKEKLYTEILLMYKRAGLNLPSKARKSFMQYELQLIKPIQQVHVNIGKSINNTLTLTKTELEGLSEDEISKFQKDATSKNCYIVHPGLLSDREVLLSKATNPLTREKVFHSNHQRSLENLPIQKEILDIRFNMASLLGYSTWADYQVDVNMAKKAINAFEFIENLSNKVEFRFKKEWEILTKENNNQIVNPWDILFLQTKYEKRMFDLDHEALRIHFPLEETLNNMLKLFSNLFQIHFEYIDLEYKWDPSVFCIKISDMSNKIVHGYLYFDLYPRPKDEKYGHFAFFTLVSGSLRNNTIPVGAIIGNFPPPKDGSPSLLNFGHVKTLFHEFGHALHGTLSKTWFSMFAGTNVPRDFVEVPSQLLEYWLEDPKVMKSISPSFPQDALNKIIKSKKAFRSIFYRRQFAYAMIDFAMHFNYNPNNKESINEIANKIYAKYFTLLPQESSILASFGHIFGGYDAGYYGYAWADSLAADLASVFRKSPKGFFDSELGIKLRKEIYERGDSRKAEDSLKQFLKREPSSESFLDSFKD